MSDKILTLNDFKEYYDKLRNEGFSEKELEYRLRTQEHVSKKNKKTFDNLRSFNFPVLSKLKKDSNLWALIEKKEILEIDNIISLFRSLDETEKNMGLDIFGQKIRDYILSEEMDNYETPEFIKMALYSNEIAKRFPEKHRNFIFHSIFQYDLEVPMLSNLEIKNYNKIPEKIKKSLEKMVQFEEPTETDSIQSLKHTTVRMGICPTTSSRVKKNLKLFEQYEFIKDKKIGKLIYVNDELVVLIKFEGTRLLYSLKTVKDSKGRYPLVVGGIYSYSNEFRTKMQQTNDIIMNVNELKVYPLTSMQGIFIDYRKVFNKDESVKKIIEKRNHLEEKFKVKEYEKITSN